MIQLSSNTRCRDRFHKGLCSRHCTMRLLHAMPLFLCDSESIAKGLVNMGWNAQRTFPLLPVAREMFLDIP